MLAAENTTQEFNFQTSIYDDALDNIYYSKSSYNWTEADMVFMQPNELPTRTDKRLQQHDPSKFREFKANFTFRKDIESYNRYYHHPELLDTFTIKQKDSPLKDDKGEVITVTDSRTSTKVTVYSHVNEALNPPDDGGISLL